MEENKIVSTQNQARKMYVSISSHGKIAFPACGNALSTLNEITQDGCILDMQVRGYVTIICSLVLRIEALEAKLN